MILKPSLESKMHFEIMEMTKLDKFNSQCIFLG
jgi:hypothetical protein